jgi:hypothetical protein
VDDSRRVTEKQRNLLRLVPVSSLLTSMSKT